jgi:hypothetical protein
MAAVAAVHRLLKLASDWNETPLRNVVFGFPCVHCFSCSCFLFFWSMASSHSRENIWGCAHFRYLDTLKLNGRPELGSGVIFFGNGDTADVASLEELLKGGERIGGLFCEVPSNPLLRSPPIRELRRLADEYDFPLVVDDSISGFCNIDVLVPNGADILVSSLTKQFSGSNNAMGGSVVLNTHSKLHHQLHTRLNRDYEQMLWKEDAATLLSASSDVETRVRRLSMPPPIPFHPSAITEFADGSHCILEGPRVVTTHTHDTASLHRPALHVRRR